jgi:hypothetical protein
MAIRILIQSQALFKLSLSGHGDGAQSHIAI